MFLYIKGIYIFTTFILQAMPLQSGKARGKHLFSGHKDIPEESRIIYWDYIASYLKVFQAKMAN